MLSTADTIVALATPPGRSALGVIRLSGPSALEIAQRLTDRRTPFQARRATLAVVQGCRSDAPDAQTAAADQVIVTTFPGPASYTGEDVVEVSAHGSPIVLRGITQAAVRLGARLAEPGEFTLRAFLNGRVDLPQAEAVADLIDAVTPAQARVAFDQLQGTVTRDVGRIDGELFELVARLEASIDFPDEGYHFIEPHEIVGRLDRIDEMLGELLASAARGRLIREGCMVAIVGEPNVGKSSLFNALVGTDRAIVSDIAGTTRDLITETIDVNGVQVTLVDTAGLRDARDGVEAQGVARSRGAARTADLIVEVLDGTRASSAVAASLAAEACQADGSERTLPPSLRVSNKADVEGFTAAPESVVVSATSGLGLDALRDAIVSALGGRELSDRPAVTNVRHIELLRRTRESVTHARSAVDAAAGVLSEEFVLADLAAARSALEEIAGRRTPDEVLRHIFERFCIGK